MTKYLIPGAADVSIAHLDMNPPDQRAGTSLLPIPDPAILFSQASVGGQDEVVEDDRTGMQGQNMCSIFVIVIILCFVLHIFL
mgnify:CR=1 FL=1